MSRQTCSRSKPGWVCLRDAGHDGPCAAAPVAGAGACSDIERCKARGCQAKCGPAAQSSGWTLPARVWALVTKLLAPCAKDCGSPCCHYGCENVTGHRW